jgi:putative DNA primase/helicase
MYSNNTEGFAGSTEYAYQLRPEGVFAEKGGKPIRICGWLRVVCNTRNGNGSEWGVLVEFRDRDGRLKQYHISMTELGSREAGYRQALLSMGLDIEPEELKRVVLTRYLMFHPRDEAEHRLNVSEVGWREQRYIGLGMQIGPEGTEKVVLQGPLASMSSREPQGTLQDWHALARLCIGNSRATFAVSAAFGSCILRKLNIEGAGFHFRGGSSIGKTNLLRLAASVWGAEILSWRSTDNGLEGLARRHNDGLMVLDEINQADPKKVGAIAYLLGNGAGKTRAAQSGDLRPRTTFNVLVLSTGEIPLSDHVKEGGGVARAGQEVRLIDIPADAGAGLGVFESLHDLPDGASLAKQIEDDSKRFFGMPIREFIRRVAEGGKPVLEEIRNLQRIIAADLVADLKAPDGQVGRAAERFAVVGAAGVMAAKWGIVPWDEPEAWKASERCFLAWLESRGGTGDHESQAIISQIQSYLETYQGSRFAEIDSSELILTLERSNELSGYKVVEGTEVIEFLVLPSAYKEMSKGYDIRQVSKVLASRGLLRVGENGKSAAVVTIRGRTKSRVYRISATIFE